MQEFGELGDLVGVHEGFVTLHVQHRIEGLPLRFESFHRFVAANRAVGAILRGHHNVAAKFLHHRGDARVVRGHHHLVASP